MRRATKRNSILAVSGTLAYLATIVFFDLGCGGDDSTAPEPPGTVTPAPVATVSVTGPASVVENGTAQFTATLHDAGGNVLTGRVVTWLSSAFDVASVSSAGLVTGYSAGVASITATSEGKSKSVPVTVTPAPVATVTVDPTPVSIPVNGAVQLFTKLKDAGGNVLTGRVVTWRSSAPTVASVSTGGLVTGVAVGGPVTIIATSETKDGWADVTVTAAGSPVVLTGRVIDFTTQTGIVGASVNFLDGGSLQVSLGSTTTGAGGTFTSPALIGPTRVMMEASATGYAAGRVLVANTPPGATTTTEAIPLVPSSASPGGISGTVRNAVTGQGIAGAVIDLYDNRGDLAFVATTANASGFFTFTGLSAGTYRLSGYLLGFLVSYRVGVAVGNNSVTPGQDIVLSPTGNKIRIVLTWGASPSDLDSHLTGPNADATRFHVYFSSRGDSTAAPFARLDLDDTNGNGPETITITQFNSGNYRYSVHDYSNRSSSSSTALGSSGAKVEVYVPNLPVQTFFVPNQAGTLWTVFEMTGTITNPVITPRNTMGVATDPGGILSPPSGGSVRVTDADLIGRAVQQHQKAKP